jgi:hypothetical protein
MLKYVIVKGLQYEGETIDDMDRREREMEKHNKRIDNLYSDWKRQRNQPMPSMQDWAKEHGMIW